MSKPKGFTLTPNTGDWLKPHPFSLLNYLPCSLLLLYLTRAYVPGLGSSSICCWVFFFKENCTLIVPVWNVRCVRSTFGTIPLVPLPSGKLKQGKLKRLKENVSFLKPDDLGFCLFIYFLYLFHLYLTRKASWEQVLIYNCNLAKIKQSSATKTTTQSYT